MSSTKRILEYNPKEFSKVRALYEEGINKIKQQGSLKLDLPKYVTNIEELNTEEAHQRIHQIVDSLINKILISGRPIVDVPSRSANNIFWDEINDLLLMGEKKNLKSLLSLSSVTDVTRLVRVLEIVHELLEKDIHATKREVYYNDVNLFKDQNNSDGNIEDVSTLMRATRNSTHIVASAKGSAVGRLRIRDKNDIIDLERLGSGGWTISPMLDEIEIIESDAEFILVVEKDAAMIRLSESRWWTKFPCIILTGKGMADMATRMFLKKLSKLGLPVFLLVDADPYGTYIASIYMRGSKRLSYESPFLATPDIHLLGVLSRDLDEYGVPDDCTIDFTKQDEKRTDELLKEDFIKSNKDWEDDLKLMQKKKKKAEIQALSSKGFEYLVEEYLPTKLSTGDWI
ncbi:MAG: hypothetical protein ACTSU2_01105 [Promethearchaeota archaeon]